MALCLIDTTTNVLQLGIDVRNTLHQQTCRQTHKHGEHILPLLDELLHESGVGKNAITYICWNSGPGSFTGLRLALAIMQAHALVYGSRVISLNSLQIMAWQAYMQHGISLPTCVLDAGKDNIYLAAYSANKHGVVATQKESMQPLHQLVAEKNTLVCLAQHQHLFTPSVVLAEDNQRLLAMAQLAKLAINSKQTQAIDNVQPLYLFEYPLNT